MFHKARCASAAPAPHRALWHALAGDSATAARAGLRPEHLHVVPGGQGIPATVVLAEHLGDSSILHLAVEGVGGLLNARLGAEDAHLDAGARVGLSVRGNWALRFDAAGKLLA